MSCVLKILGRRKVRRRVRKNLQKTTRQQRLNIWRLFIITFLPHLKETTNRVPSVPRILVGSPRAWKARLGLEARRPRALPCPRLPCDHPPLGSPTLPLPNAALWWLPLALILMSLPLTLDARSARVALRNLQLCPTTPPGMVPMGSPSRSLPTPRLPQLWIPVADSKRWSARRRTCLVLLRALPAISHQRSNAAVAANMSARPTSIGRVRCARTALHPCQLPLQ
jgi:hypothetical protein